MNYDMARQPTEGFVQLKQQTIRERLEQQKENLATKLADVQAALKLMDENPKLEEFHNAVTKANIGLY